MSSPVEGGGLDRATLLRELLARIQMCLKSVDAMPLAVMRIKNALYQLGSGFIPFLYLETRSYFQFSGRLSSRQAVTAATYPFARRFLLTTKLPRKRLWLKRPVLLQTLQCS